MSESQNEDLLNEEEMNDMLTNKKTPKSKINLNTWTIYCKKRGKKSIQQEYSKDLEEVGTFNTLNIFFSFYSSIKQPSSLEQDTKIIYFLKECKPFWQEWLHSGCLLITLKFKDEEKDKVGARVLNSLWQFLLFGLIGNNLPKSRTKNQFSHPERAGSENIIGLILSRRDKICLIEVWFRTETFATQLSRQIQEDIRSHLKLKTMQQKNVISSIKYKRHKDSIETNSTIKGAHSIKAVVNKSF